VFTTGGGRCSWRASRNTREAQEQRERVPLLAGQRRSGSGQDPLELILIELMHAAGLVRRITTNLNQAVAKLTATGQPAGDLPRYAAESRRRANHIDAVADAVRKALQRRSREPRQ
jgi:hypothetical protein